MILELLVPVMMANLVWSYDRGPDVLKNKSVIQWILDLVPEDQSVWLLCVSYL